MYKPLFPYKTYPGVSSDQWQPKGEKKGRTSGQNHKRNIIKEILSDSMTEEAPEAPFYGHVQ